MLKLASTADKAMREGGHSAQRLADSGAKLADSSAEIANAAQDLATNGKELSKRTDENFKKLNRLTNRNFKKFNTITEKNFKKFNTNVDKIVQILNTIFNPGASSPFVKYVKKLILPVSLAGAGVLGIFYGSKLENQTVSFPEKISSFSNAGDWIVAACKGSVTTAAFLISAGLFIAGCITALYRLASEDETEPAPSPDHQEQDVADVEPEPDSVPDVAEENAVEASPVQRASPISRDARLNELVNDWRRLESVFERQEKNHSALQDLIQELLNSRSQLHQKNLQDVFDLGSYVIAQQESTKLLKDTLRLSLSSLEQAANHLMSNGTDQDFADCTPSEGFLQLLRENVTNENFIHGNLNTLLNDIKDKIALNLNKDLTWSSIHTLDLPRYEGINTVAMQITYSEKMQDYLEEYLEVLKQRTQDIQKFIEQAEYGTRASNSSCVIQ